MRGRLMSLDVYIVRFRDFETGAEEGITVEEWLSVAGADPELRPAGPSGHDAATYVWTGDSDLPDPWFAWDDGRVYTKNPDDPVLTKLQMLASRLNGLVVTGDGHLLEPGLGLRPLPARGLFEILKDWLRALLPGPPCPDPGFARGDRVVDLWGNRGVVVRLSLRGLRGAGKVVVRYEDGRTAVTTLRGGTIYRKDLGR